MRKALDKANQLHQACTTVWEINNQCRMVNNQYSQDMDSKCNQDMDINSNQDMVNSQCRCNQDMVNNKCKCNQVTANNDNIDY